MSETFLNKTSVSMANKLTPSQLKVVEHAYKPGSTLKVVAGPGSGKTFTLLRKVHHLVATEQVKPNEILVLSLTNRAVDSINDKLLGVFEEYNDSNSSAEDLKDIVDQIGVFTIHGLANRLVVEHEGMINIIEENGWRGLLKLISTDFWGSRKVSTPTARNLERLLKAYKVDSKDKTDKTLLEIVKIMEDCKVLTNDDLILKATQYLKTNTEAASADEFLISIKNKYKIVLIDEFQDLYPILLPIIEVISKGKQLILFGDSNQSIYEFLGSNKKVIAQLDSLHPPEETETLHLYDNFRSTPEIIEAAKSVNANSFHKYDEKDLVLKPKSTIKPIVCNFTDQLEQLEFLISEITKLVCTNVKLLDIAILSRTNAHLDVIADHMNKYNIPFNKLTTQPDWLLDTRIQFLIDIIKVAVFSHQKNNNLNILDRQSDFSVVVTLSALRGIGTKAIQTLYTASLQKNLSLWRYITEIPKTEWPTCITNKKKIIDYTEILAPVVEDETLWNSESPLYILETVSSLISKLDYTPLKDMNIEEMTTFRSHLEDMYKVLKLCTLNKPPGFTLVEWFLETFFDQSAIYHHAELKSEMKGQGRINLSTIHSSKGLEYPVTFVVNSQSDGFPMENNTLYVGMTRARNLLYMVNMNHDTIKPYKEPLLFQNEKFWNYYNNDLKRSTTNLPYILSNNAKNYSHLQNKYGLRQYSTIVNRLIRKLRNSPL